MNVLEPIRRNNKWNENGLFTLSSILNNELKNTSLLIGFL